MLTPIFAHDEQARSLPVSGRGEDDQTAVGRPTRFFVMPLRLREPFNFQGLGVDREEVKDVALVPSCKGDEVPSGRPCRGLIVTPFKREPF